MLKWVLIILVVGYCFIPNVFAINIVGVDFDPMKLKKDFLTLNIDSLENDIKNYCHDTVQSAPFSKEAKEAIALSSFAHIIMKVESDIKRAIEEIELLDIIFTQANNSSLPPRQTTILTDDAVRTARDFFESMATEYSSLKEETGIRLYGNISDGFKKVNQTLIEINKNLEKKLK